MIDRRHATQTTVRAVEAGRPSAVTLPDDDAQQ